MTSIPNEHEIRKPTVYVIHHILSKRPIISLAATDKTVRGFLIVETPPQEVEWPSRTSIAQTDDNTVFDCHGNSINPASGQRF